MNDGKYFHHFNVFPDLSKEKIFSQTPISLTTNITL